jgi:hypothetical protein
VEDLPAAFREAEAIAPWGQEKVQVR